MGNKLTPQAFFFNVFDLRVLCRLRVDTMLLADKANAFRPTDPAVRKKKNTYTNKQHEGRERPLGFSDLCIGFSNPA